tara:strand:- start:19 stop:300 length:282 start_codon:yes stop_codon:yes gene_type:complete
MICIIRDAEDKDFVNPTELIKNWRNKEKVRELGNGALEKVGEPLARKVVGVLDWMLDYVDKNMLHTESAKKLVQGDYEYYKKCGKYLVEKFNF